MTEHFNPYRKWLGISSKDLPPTHYRLLSIDIYEADLDVISNAADRQMSFVREHQAGKHSEACQKLLNELARARVTLLNPESKSEYDAGLCAELLEKKKQGRRISIGPTDPVSAAPPVQQASSSSSEVASSGLPAAKVVSSDLPAAIRSGNPTYKKSIRKAGWYANVWIITLVVIAICLGVVYYFIHDAIQQRKTVTANGNVPDQSVEETPEEPGRPGVEEEIVDPLSPPVDNRLPAPTQGSLQTALTGVRGTYFAALNEARSDPGKLYLVSRRLHDVAASREPGDVSFKSNKNAATWMLCAETAAKAGDSRSIRIAAEELARLFKFEESDLLEQYLPAVHLDGLNASLFACDMAAASETALCDGNPELAITFLDLAEETLLNSQDQGQVEDLLSRRPIFENVVQFQETFDISALQDRDLASLTEEERKRLGWFLCFLCNDWEDGLYYMATSNASEASIAVCEMTLSDEPTFEELKTLAEQWWDLAIDVSSLESWEPCRERVPLSTEEMQALQDTMAPIRFKNIRCHAAKLYQCALEELDENPLGGAEAEAIEAEIVQRIERGRTKSPPFLSNHEPSTGPPLDLDCRRAEYRSMAARTHGSTTTGELALLAAIEWIVSEQSNGGYWYGERNEAPNGGVALALLPLLVEYPIKRNSDFETATDSGLIYLIEHGTVVPSSTRVMSFFEPAAQRMYSHPLATIALCEITALVPDPKTRILGSSAVEFIVGTQNEDGGWGLRPDYQNEPASQSDIRSFALNVMAIHAARRARIGVPSEVSDNAKRFLRSLATQDRQSYNARLGNSPARAASSSNMPAYLQQEGVQHPDSTSTSLGVLCEIFLDDVQDPLAIDAYVLEQLDTGPNDDVLYNWAMTWLIAEWSPERLHEWIGPLQERLIESQMIAGRNAGSWTSSSSFAPGETDDETIRFHTTCINALILQTAYRYPPMRR